MRKEYSMSHAKNKYTNKLREIKKKKSGEIYDPPLAIIYARDVWRWSLRKFLQKKE